jgi:hypothetical protein
MLKIAILSKLPILTVKYTRKRLSLGKLANAIIRHCCTAGSGRYYCKARF